MKTPREILLARHGESESQLDAIRRRAVAAAPAPLRDRRFPLMRLAESCRREFFRMPRIAWAGLAAAWVMIVGLNLASSEAPPANPALAASAPRRSPETVQALREQRRLFTELVGASAEKMDAEAPRFLPRPRSERSPQTGAA